MTAAEVAVCRLAMTSPHRTHPSNHRNPICTHLLLRSNSSALHVGASVWIVAPEGVVSVIFPRDSATFQPAFVSRRSSSENSCESGTTGKGA